MERHIWSLEALAEDAGNQLMVPLIQSKISKEVFDSITFLKHSTEESTAYHIREVLGKFTTSREYFSYVKKDSCFEYEPMSTAEALIAMVEKKQPVPVDERWTRHGPDGRILFRDCLRDKASPLGIGLPVTYWLILK